MITWLATNAKQQTTQSAQARIFHLIIMLASPLQIQMRKYLNTDSNPFKFYVMHYVIYP